MGRQRHLHSFGHMAHPDHPPLTGCWKTIAGPVCGVAARAEPQRTHGTPRFLALLRRASRPPHDVFQQPANGVRQ